MKDIYPIDVFPSVWEKLMKTENENVISPREVLKELERQDDELLDWAKQNMLFREPDSNQLKMVDDIVKSYKLVDPNKFIDADPFVVALSKIEKRTVVTQEKYVNLSGPNSKPKIPNVCEALDIRCIPVLEFFREQGLSL